MIRFFFITLFPFIFAWSQNSFDANGLRDGEWFGFHENGKIKYSGQFKNGIEFGIFKYYDYDGNLVVNLDYIEPGIKSRATIYSSLGLKNSKGIYLNRKKDSLWTHYSNTGSIVSKEFYIEGVLNGQALYYYNNGNVSEKCHYSNSLKNGLSEIFYKSGFVSARCMYLNNQLNGTAEYYYDKINQLESTGNYTKGVKDSVWIFFNEQGDTLKIVNYSALD